MFRPCLYHCIANDQVHLIAKLDELDPIRKLLLYQRFDKETGIQCFLIVFKSLESWCERRFQNFGCKMLMPQLSDWERKRKSRFITKYSTDEIFCQTGATSTLIRTMEIDLVIPMCDEYGFHLAFSEVPQNSCVWPARQDSLLFEILISSSRVKMWPLQCDYLLQCSLRQNRNEVKVPNQISFWYPWTRGAPNFLNELPFVFTPVWIVSLWGPYFIQEQCNTIQARGLALSRLFCSL